MINWLEKYARERGGKLHFEQRQWNDLSFCCTLEESISEFKEQFALCYKGACFKGQKKNPNTFFQQTAPWLFFIMTLPMYLELGLSRACVMFVIYVGESACSCTDFV